MTAQYAVLLVLITVFETAVAITAFVCRSKVSTVSLFCYSNKNSWIYLNTERLHNYICS